MNKIFKFALAALPIVMLASCAKDDLETEAPKAEKSETRYLRVTLSTSNATPDTRAGIVGDSGEYQDGTAEENLIKTLEFYFYDRNKQFHSYRAMTTPEMPVSPEDNPREEDKVNDDGTITPGSPNIHGFYHCNVPIELTQGQNLPTYVVCIVNSAEGSQYQAHTMEDAQAKKLSKIYANGFEDQYFGMSNSVYYGIDDVTGASGVLIMAAPFTPDKLLTESQLETLEKQTEGTGTNQNDIERYTINIPVERYAVKVNLDLKSLTETTMPPYSVIASGVADPAPTPAAAGENPNATPTPITLKFTPMKWAVNATEKTFYFLKSFREPIEGKFEPSNEFSTLDEVNTYVKWAWNNATHKRCFWARTPAYYADNYPLTGDDVTDNKAEYEADKSNNTKPEEEKTQLYTLEYKSWKDCDDISAGTDGTYGTLCDYVKETTMMGNRLSGSGLADQYLPTASLPSIILLGQYTIEGMDEPTDFYLYGHSGSKPVVYSGNTEIPNTKNIKKQLVFEQTIVLQQNPKNPKEYLPLTEFNEDDPDKPVWTEEQKAAFVVAHPSKEVRDYFASTESIQGSRLRIASNVQTLQLASLPAGKTLYFYNPRKDNGTNQPAGGYQEIKQADLTYVNLLLYQNLGGAQYYKNGMAYFNAPIQHWGWQRTNNENKGKTMDKWDWAKMETGDFGVVRNHIYTMKIGKIEGLGTGIADEKDPIVPPADKVKYSVHFHVNIQKWAVLPVQEWNW